MHSPAVGETFIAELEDYMNVIRRLSERMQGVEDSWVKKSRNGIAYYDWGFGFSVVRRWQCDFRRIAWSGSNRFVAPVARSNLDCRAFRMAYESGFEKVICSWSIQSKLLIDIRIDKFNFDTTPAREKTRWQSTYLLPIHTDKTSDRQEKKRLTGGTERA